MTKSERNSVNREDWLRETLVALRESGVGGVKIVSIARRMELTSGSFYWHFKNLQDLLDAVLDHWEHALTDHIIQDAVNCTGSPIDRIYQLMEQVIVEGAAEVDSAISVWSKSDEQVKAIFERTVKRRFEFATWMFSQAGFGEAEAKVRGRMMVAYLMGESASGLKADPDWKETLKSHWSFLVSRTGEASWLNQANMK